MQFFLALVIVFGGWYAWRALRREMNRVDDEIEATRPRPADTLERDPATGRYKVKDEGR